MIQLIGTLNYNNESIFDAIYREGEHLGAFEAELNNSSLNTD
jgi:hypothetical protein